MKFASAHQILLALTLFLFTHHAALAAESDADYVLGPGDVLSVKDKDGAVSAGAVLPDGTAVVNYAGVVEAAGKTVGDISDLVNEAAKKWSVSTHIEVTLDHQRPAQVYVLGQVTHPSLYTPTEEVTKSSTATSKTKESFTILKALDMAGGLKENADIKHLHVTRLHPKIVIDVNLWKLMLDGDVTEDLVLQPGDVIYVPAAGTESGTTKDSGKIVPVAKKIRVIGAVKNPILLVISEDSIDLSVVIARAGGFRDDSKQSILVARTSDAGRIVTEHIAVDSKHKYPDQRLKAGDIVIVKSNTTSRVNDTPSTPKIPGLPQNMFIGDFDQPRNLMIKP